MGNITTGQVGANREKNWDELNTEEKMERMRRIIKRQADFISQLQSGAHSLRTNLKNHIHLNEMVMIVTEAKEYETNLDYPTGIAKLHNDEYF